MILIGLRNQDPVTILAAHQRISERLGLDFADATILQVINSLIEKEDWSFFDEDGEPLGLY